MSTHRRIQKNNTTKQPTETVAQQLPLSKPRRLWNWLSNNWQNIGPAVIAIYDILHTIGLL